MLEVLRKMNIFNLLSNNLRTSGEYLRYSSWLMKRPQSEVHNRYVKKNGNRNNTSPSDT